jgi:hypothetical protein
VDKTSKAVDFFLSRDRDVNAAKTFLRNAMKNRRTPTKITLDAYAASHRAVREMKETGELPRRVKVRSSQYLNNLVEQDHRRIKQRIRPMLGFKRFDHAVVTISGIELAEQIKKGQFKTGKFGSENRLCRNCGMRRLPLDFLCRPSLWQSPANLITKASLHQSPLDDLRALGFPAVDPLDQSKIDFFLPELGHHPDRDYKGLRWQLVNRGMARVVLLSKRA